DHARPHHAERRPRPTGADRGAEGHPPRPQRRLRDVPPREDPDAQRDDHPARRPLRGGAVGRAPAAHRAAVRRPGGDLPIGPAYDARYAKSSGGTGGLVVTRRRRIASLATSVSAWSMAPNRRSSSPRRRRNTMVSPTRTSVPA